MAIFPFGSAVHAEAQVAISACKMIASGFPIDHYVALNANLEVGLLDVNERISVLTFKVSFACLVGVHKSVATSTVKHEA